MMNADIRLGVGKLLAFLICLSYVEAFYIPGTSNFDLIPSSLDGC
jgi:hypothetical protein